MVDLFELCKVVAQVLNMDELEVRAMPIIDLYELVEIKIEIDPDKLGCYIYVEKKEKESKLKEINYGTDKIQRNWN